ncbi:MAG: DUF1972 domain-containing protein [Pirellulales bacterium]|nr:DUF1972 domain-containing protein [Pirellulales bacterium]
MTTTITSEPAPLAGVDLLDPPPLALAPAPEPVREAAETHPAPQKRTRHAIAILGTRGIPARHGGFETFAERLALHLVERGWQVTVYCQHEGEGAIAESQYQGARLISIPERRAGAAGTVIFDWKSTRRAMHQPGLALTLGYNTAAFTAWYRLRRVPSVINMDGLEWQRGKWGRAARAWLRWNEWFACRLADHLVADHPEIARYLQTVAPRSRITMIPYGADRVDCADQRLIEAWGLAPRSYALVVARPEPENSLLEIVSAFSRRPRGLQLVVLGDYRPEENAYQRRVLEAASSEVVFPGAIYDRDTVDALRFFARAYLHGHTVGGTNPALVEALAAGCPVLAHDNRFNRWVAGPEAAYFADEDACARALDALLDDASRLARMSSTSRARHAEAFTWERVLGEYEALLAPYARLDDE